MNAVILELDFVYTTPNLMDFELNDNRHVHLTALLCFNTNE